jgi:hypothetical protein
MKFEKSQAALDRLTPSNVGLPRSRAPKGPSRESTTTTRSLAFMST